MLAPPMRRLPSRRVPRPRPGPCPGALSRGAGSPRAHHPLAPRSRAATARSFPPLRAPPSWVPPGWAGVGAFGHRVASGFAPRMPIRPPVVSEPASSEVLGRRTVLGPTQGPGLSRSRLVSVRSAPELPRRAPVLRHWASLQPPPGRSPSVVSTSFLPKSTGPVPAPLHSYKEARGPGGIQDFGGRWATFRGRLAGAPSGRLTGGSWEVDGRIAGARACCCHSPLGDPGTNPATNLTSK